MYTALKVQWVGGAQNAETPANERAGSKNCYVTFCSNDDRSTAAAGRQDLGGASAIVVEQPAERRRECSPELAERRGGGERERAFLESLDGTAGTSGGPDRGHRRPGDDARGIDPLLLEQLLLQLIPRGRAHLQTPAPEDANRAWHRIASSNQHPVSSNHP